jgi:hypothetical protein
MNDRYPPPNFKMPKNISFVRETMWSTPEGNPIMVKDLSDGYLFESFANTSSDILLQEMIYRLFAGRLDASKAFKP